MDWKPQNCFQIPAYLNIIETATKIKNMRKIYKQLKALYTTISIITYPTSISQKELKNHLETLLAALE